MTMYYRATRKITESADGEVDHVTPKPYTSLGDATKITPEVILELRNQGREVVIMTVVRIMSVESRTVTIDPKDNPT